MAENKIIQFKRGLITNVADAVLKEGEFALAFDAEKKVVQLYVGTGADEGKGKICINPDVTADIAKVLTDANSYTDTKIAALVGTAPEALDTIQELAQAIKDNEDVVTAINEAIGNKVDKEEGKGLSSNDFTDEEKAKLSGIAPNAQANTITGVKGENEDNFQTGNVTITKSGMGLGNVDNTADKDKPVSDAVKTELDKKMDADADIDCGTF